MVFLTAKRRESAKLEGRETAEYRGIHGNGIWLERMAGRMGLGWMGWMGFVNRGERLESAKRLIPLPCPGLVKGAGCPMPKSDLLPPL